MTKSTLFTHPHLGPRDFLKNEAVCEEMLYFRGESHRVLQGAPPRGRQLYFTFQVLQTLYSKHQKHPFLPLELQPRRGHPVKHRLRKA